MQNTTYHLQILGLMGNAEFDFDFYRFMCFFCYSKTFYFLKESDSFGTIAEPTFIYQYHPKSMFYSSVLSWLCTFYEFGWMSNDIYSTL